MRSRYLAATAAVLAVLALAGCRPEPEPGASGSPAPTGTASTETPTTTDTPTSTETPSAGADPTETVAPDAEAPDAPSIDADDVCSEAGGQTQVRQPMSGTDGDRESWVAIGEPVVSCRFEMGEGETSSRLYVDPVTISSETPTLAAIAYLSQTPVPDESAANPAAALCDALGGTSSYGTSIAGGGLVDPSDSVEPVVAVCMFADGSFIDEWAIAYYSADTIQGIDLTSVLKFDPTEIPDLYSDAVG